MLLLMSESEARRSSARRIATFKSSKLRLYKSMDAVYENGLKRSAAEAGPAASSSSSSSSTAHPQPIYGVNGVDLKDSYLQKRLALGEKHARQRSNSDGTVPAGGLAERVA